MAGGHGAGPPCRSRKTCHSPFTESRTRPSSMQGRPARLACTLAWPCGGGGANRDALRGRRVHGGRGALYRAGPPAAGRGACAAAGTAAAAGDAAQACLSPSSPRARAAHAPLLLVAGYARHPVGGGAAGGAGAGAGARQPVGSSLHGWLTNVEVGGRGNVHPSKDSPIESAASHHTQTNTSINTFNIL